MMNIQTLKKKDYDKAIQFAIEGMHFDQYISNHIVRQLYGRHFLYTELERASHVLTAYEGEELRGLLIAEVKGHAQPFQSFWHKLYVKSFNWLMQVFAGETAGAYDQVNQEMLADYKKSYQPDGEIIFLAADPHAKVRCIGSQLLAHFEKQVEGKEIFLYTDSNCTYPFYEKRGFERACQKHLQLKIGQKTIPLNCFLYRKQIGKQSLCRSGSSVTL